MTVKTGSKVVPQRVTSFSERESNERWDANALIRNEELSGNGDPSYRALKNIILETLASTGIEAGDHVLDVGAGLGYFSAELADRGFLVDAIDPSAASISMARENHNLREATHLEFYAASLQDFVERNPNRVYDAIIANMTLHSVSDLQGFMFGVESLLSPNGVFVATIPNPRTYLQSRPDLDVTDLDLRVEQVIEVDFRIRNHEPHPARIFFHHRPIRLYSVAGDNASIPLRDSRVPERVGPGRPRDIAVLEFDRSTRA